MANKFSQIIATQVANNKSNVNALGALIVRFMGMGLQFLSVLIMARALGAEDIGLFSLYASLLVLISAVIGFGSPINSFSLVSRLHIQENWGNIRHYFHNFLKVMAGISVVLLLVYIGLNQATGLLSASYQAVLPYSLFGAVIFVLLRNAFEFMQAMEKTTLAMALENVAAPMAMIVFIMTLTWWGEPIQATWVMVVNITIFVLLTGLMFKITIPKLEQHLNKPSGESLKIFNKSTLALWGSSILDMAFVNVPTILAAQVASMADVGRFSIAFRFIGMIVSLLMVVRGTFGRDLIKQYQDKDYLGCNLSLRSMQKFGLLIYVPIMVIFAIGGEFLFNLFGKSFDGAYLYLLILGSGQLVYAAFGFSGFALVALDESKFEAFVSLLCMLLMVVIVWLLRDYSAKGVAVAYSVSISLRSFLPYLYVKRKLSKLLRNGVK
jgi:O-antigen/teichoic acid export membrane protein